MRKNIFQAMHESVQFFAASCVYWSGYGFERRSSMRMDTSQTGDVGDVDDLIFQDSWLTSDR